MGGETNMGNRVHLRHVLGGSFCGIDGYHIYTRKDTELANMDRLTEVTCQACLFRAMKWHQQQSIEQTVLENQITDMQKWLEQILDSEAEDER